MANSIRQTSHGTGTGSLILNVQKGRPSFYAFFGVGGADMFFYSIVHAAADEWEAGTGHLQDAVTLVRDTVVTSSNKNTWVDFSAGEKEIVNTLALI
jgi:hypothetical protein